MHKTTFEYLKPTDQQLNQMSVVRTAFRDLEANLNDNVPEGPDKTYLLRKLREVGMWANVAITRLPDGTPRLDPEDTPKLNFDLPKALTEKE
mgnify:CR=1 FL=1